MAEIVVGKVVFGVGVASNAEPSLKAELEQLEKRLKPQVGVRVKLEGAGEAQALNAQIKALSNQANSLRNEFQATGNAGAGLKKQLGDVRREALELAAGLVRNHGEAAKATDEYRKLTLVAAQAERTLAGINGGLSRLGIGEQLARALGPAGAQLRNVTQAAAAFGGQLGLVASTAGALNPALLGVGAALAGVASVTTQAFKNTADFEEAINDAAITLEANARQQDQLASSAKRLGGELKTSSVEIARAFEELGTQGVSVEDVLGGAARATVLLARATKTELSEAAAIAGQAKNAFGFAGDEFEQLADVITNAANKTALRARDFFDIIGQGGAAAKIANVPFAEFAATIALTRAYFSSASDAGTSFKAFIAGLTPNSKQAAEAMKNLGFSAFDAQGKIRALPEIVNDLRDRLGSLSQQRRLELLELIFGSDGARTAIALIEQGGDAISGLRGELEKTGSAAEQADKRFETFRGAQQRLADAFQNRLIGPNGVLQPLVGLLNGIASALERAQAASNVDINIKVKAQIEGDQRALELGLPNARGTFQSLTGIAGGLSASGITFDNAGFKQFVRDQKESAQAAEAQAAGNKKVAASVDEVLKKARELVAWSERATGAQKVAADAALESFKKQGDRQRLAARVAEDEAREARRQAEEAKREQERAQKEADQARRERERVRQEQEHRAFERALPGLSDAQLAERARQQRQIAADEKASADARLEALRKIERLEAEAERRAEARRRKAEEAAKLQAVRVEDAFERSVNSAADLEGLRILQARLQAQRDAAATLDEYTRASGRLEVVTRRVNELTQEQARLLRDADEALEDLLRKQNQPVLEKTLGQFQNPEAAAAFVRRFYGTLDAALKAGVADLTVLRTAFPERFKEAGDAAGKTFGGSFIYATQQVLSAGLARLLEEKDRTPLGGAAPSGADGNDQEAQRLVGGVDTSTVEGLREALDLLAQFGLTQTRTFADLKKQLDENVAAAALVAELLGPGLEKAEGPVQVALALRKLERQGLANTEAYRGLLLLQQQLNQRWEEGARKAEDYEKRLEEARRQVEAFRTQGTAAALPPELLEELRRQDFAAFTAEGLQALIPQLEATSGASDLLLRVWTELYRRGRDLAGAVETVYDEAAKAYVPLRQLGESGRDAGAQFGEWSGFIDEVASSINLAERELKAGLITVQEYTDEVNTQIATLEALLESDKLSAEQKRLLRAVIAELRAEQAKLTAQQLELAEKAKLVQQAFDGALSALDKMASGDMIAGIRGLISAVLDLAQALGVLNAAQAGPIAAFAALFLSFVERGIQEVEKNVVGKNKELAEELRRTAESAKKNLEAVGVTGLSEELEGLSRRIGDFWDNLLRRDQVEEFKRRAEEIKTQIEVIQKVAQPIGQSIADALYEGIVSADFGKSKEALNLKLRQFLVKTIVETAVAAALASGAIGEQLESFGTVVAEATRTGDFSKVAPAIEALVGTANAIFDRLAGSLSAGLSGLDLGGSPAGGSGAGAISLPAPAQVAVATPLLEAANTLHEGAVIFRAAAELFAREGVRVVLVADGGRRYESQTDSLR